MASKIKEIEITLFGKVQAVGFRTYAKKHADERGISGWITNREDGQVDIVAQGEEEQLLDFIALIRKGPVFSRIQDMKVIWYDKPQDTLTEFVIE